MKIKLIILFLILGFPLRGMEVKDIKYLIREAEKEVVDLTVIWDLKESKSFLILEKNADIILNHALELLQSNDLSLQQKMILILAIQNANFNNYKKFLYDLAICYKNGKIDKYIMKRAISPYDWSFKIIENYKDKEIIKILKICLDYEKIDNELKEIIIDILTGKVWKERKKFLQDRK